jgi:hypothetical protein
MGDRLYLKIAEALNINNRLRIEIFNFGKELRKYESFPGYSEIKIGELPVIDTQEVQRNLFQEYSNNTVLKDAINGRMTLENSLLELFEAVKPVKRLFPQRKDKTHNERWDNMRELIHCPYGLRKDGLFLSGSFVGGVAFSTAIIYGLCKIGAPLLIGTDPNPNINFMAFTEAFPAYMNLIMAPILGFGFHKDKSVSYNERDLAFKEARILDNKTRQLL